MSGHSKWKKIKRQKTASDLKKGNIFTKLGQAITIAVKEGGGDPDMNFILRIAIDKAKEANMPKDTIERAIKKGTGEGKSEQLISVMYEIVGEDGVAILVDCLTDNKNRTISEIRKVISNSSFSIGSGSLRWQFEEKGRLVVQSCKKEEVIIRGKREDCFNEVDIEEVVLEVMEIDGVEDVEEEKKKIKGVNDIIVIITSKGDFRAVYSKVEEKGLKILKAEMVKIAKNKVNVDDNIIDKVNEITGKLEENPDVTVIWSNISILTRDK